MYQAKNIQDLLKEFAISRLCPKCCKGMRLAYVMPGKPGYDLRTFECNSCGHEDTICRAIEFGPVYQN